MQDIKRVSSKIGILERRLDHLEQRVKRYRDEGRPAEATSFDENEVGALKAAVHALKLYRVFQETELDPILALAEVIDTVALLEDEWETDGINHRGSDTRIRLLEARDRAKRIVAEAA